jgi:hypothetical protein
MLIHTIMLGAGLLGAFASGPVGDLSQRSAQAGNPEVVVAVHYSARSRLRRQAAAARRKKQLIEDSNKRVSEQMKAASDGFDNLANGTAQNFKCSLVQGIIKCPR